MLSPCPDLIPEIGHLSNQDTFYCTVCTFTTVDSSVLGGMNIIIPLQTINIRFIGWQLMIIDMPHPKGSVDFVNSWLLYFSGWLSKAFGNGWCH